MMLLSVRACAAPESKKPMLPKRMTRARRVMESKRMDTFREVHETLKKTAKSEQAFIRDFFDKTRSMWRDDEEDVDETEDVGPTDVDK